MNNDNEMPNDPIVNAPDAEQPSASAEPAVLASSDTPSDVSVDNDPAQLLRASVQKVIVGQESVITEVLTALLANGHVLVEGVPGLGKTLLVRALAACFKGAFKRIQFTPDLMPADVTGHALYDMKESRFRIRKGPVFTNLLLADEINRSPAKTQAALLEVMQERQVTIEGEAMRLPAPFLVLATQNPIEQEGTYPLPEAELDRFLMKVYIDYPTKDEEIALAMAATDGKIDAALKDLEENPPMLAEDIVALQRRCEEVAVEDAVIEYAVRLARATRSRAGIINGAGPRASLGMITAARASAMLAGRDFVLPDDVKTVALPVLRHRINLSADLEIDGQTADSVLETLLDSVEAPRG